MFLNDLFVCSSSPSLFINHYNSSNSQNTQNSSRRSSPATTSISTKRSNSNNNNNEWQYSPNKSLNNHYNDHLALQYDQAKQYYRQNITNAKLNGNIAATNLKLQSKLNNDLIINSIQSTMNHNESRKL